MGVLNKFTFGNVDSSDYGILLSGEATMNAPARNVDKVSVPGRNGDLLLDQNSFQNITVTYPCTLYKTTRDNLLAELSYIRGKLASRKGYQRLEDTFYPDYFRLGCFKEGLEVDPVMYNSAARFDIVFDCKPQRFLISGEDPITYTASGTIQNPTWFASSPLLEVTGNGYFEISGYRITVENNPGKIYIDTDIVEAWSESGGVKTSQNGNVTYRNHAIMKIASGTTNVVLSGITKLVVTPRWWRL